MHSVVACGLQGADEDAEKLSSFVMQICANLRSFVRVNLVLLLATSTWSPPRSLACSKGSRLGSGLIYRVLARAAGVESDATCNGDWACLEESRRDFILGCPLAGAALGGCWVDCCRWIQPHFSVCASFLDARWSAKVTQPVKVSPLWSASWVSAVDKSRMSKSAEGRGIWEIHDNCLQFVLVGYA